MDFIDMHPISPRLEGPVRAALRGEAVPWPDDLTDDEARSLVDHGVAPLVFEAAGVPRLREAAIRAAALEALRSEDLRHVLAALAAGRVEALLIKGSGLAYEIYAKPELRPRGDTDLLIAEESIERTRAILRDAGCVEQPTSGDEHGVRQMTFLRKDANGVQHAYDVHWAVTNTPLFAHVLRFEDVRHRAVAVPPLGPHARTLAVVDALLLACVHRVAHHHDSERLIWLVDIALLRDRMGPEEHRRFWRMAADAGVVAVCSRSIELADAWMSRPARNRAADWLSPVELERDEPSKRFLDREITYGRVILADLRALAPRDRIRRLWQLAFPPASFMRHNFPGHSTLSLPWLYLYRGTRGIGRLFRKGR
jgi:Uncharacterised nucleotidyltransferase